MDIQGFGYFAEFNGAFEQQVAIDTRGFSATAIAIPEPSAYGAGLGLFVLIVGLISRRRLSPAVRRNCRL